MKPLCVKHYLALLVLGGCVMLQVNAQTVYRIIGSDGRLTFSDQPPPTGTPAALTTSPGTGATASNGTAALPYLLRQTAAKFPVVLYSAANCPPCDSMRNQLRQRGIPYTEHTVHSADDIAALQSLTSDSSLPFATIGSQHLNGYSQVVLDQTLDAAGYPTSSALPAGYVYSPATPLTGPARTPAASSATADKPAAKATPPSAPAPVRQDNQGNPAGIQF